MAGFVIRLTVCAGKSILVGALGLLCGERADTAAIRGGAAKAELSAGFDLPPDSPALLWLQDAALDDGRSCLLRRMISDSGRSRAWINGTAVTLQQLAELGELLVEIHGQNEHIRLVRSEEQLRLLDGGGGYDRELAEVRQRCASWSALEGERQSLLEEKPLDAADRDLLEYQVRELESELLPADAFAALEAEHRMLARGGEVMGALEYAAEVLELPPKLVRRVVGVDINPRYIATARRRYDRRFEQLELICYDVVSPDCRFEPVDLVFAGLVFEYIDYISGLSSMMRFIRSRGSLSVILQLPGDNMASISPSPYSSLGKLTSLLKFVSPESLEDHARPLGLSVVASRQSILGSGKAFHELLFRSPVASDL